MVIEQSLDKLHRHINYLRLSVTDRCNLRCMYCMPEEGIPFLPHRDILTYEEMLRLVKISTRCGIRKVRLTGGEPLARKGFINFLERLSDIDALDEITLTTNAVLLKEYAADIMDCGICRINISLDSLKPERFFHITGRDQFDRVWEGIQEAERMGFNPIKINVVAIKGVNDDEILDFARLTREKPYHVRFIELMPVGKENMWSVDKFISTEEIFERIQTLGALKPVLSNPLDGPGGSSFFYLAMAQSIYLFLFFFSFFSFRFSLGLSIAFFCCSFLPLSLLPLSPIAVVSPIWKKEVF